MVTGARAPAVLATETEVGVKVGVVEAVLKVSVEVVKAAVVEVEVEEVEVVVQVVVQVVVAVKVVGRDQAILVLLTMRRAPAPFQGIRPRRDTIAGLQAVHQAQVVQVAAA